MRPIAHFALTHLGATPQANTEAGRSVGQTVQAWLDVKGTWSAEGDHLALHLGDGRRAQLDTARTANNSAGTIDSWQLTEPIVGGWFETEIRLAVGTGNTSLVVRQRAGNPNTVISPFYFDAASPRLLHRLLEGPRQWSCGTTIMRSAPAKVLDKSAGRKLADELRNPSRSVPIVVVSEFDGFQIHPDLDVELAKDVCGLALVYRLSQEGSFGLTEELGREWSCFHGGVRIYWPGLDPGQSPLLHPLWLAERLVEAAGSSAGAAARVRRQIRRRILGLSTFTIAEPPIFLDVAREQRRAADQSNLVKMLESDNDRLEKENKVLKNERNRLQTDVENLRLQLQHAQSSTAAPDADDMLEVPSATEAPPQSIEDAVRMAGERNADVLAFGDDVFKKGVRGLAPEAGPPSKVLHHLDSLARFGRQLFTSGRLGKRAEQWLKDECNVVATPDEVDRVFADDQGKRMSFTMHSKPNEHTDPAKCVRIYYKLDDARGKVVVGWVGRHP